MLRDDDSPALDIEPDDGFEPLLGAAVHYRIATGGINHPRAPPLHAPQAQPPDSPSPALS